MMRDWQTLNRLQLVLWCIGGGFQLALAFLKPSEWSSHLSWFAMSAAAAVSKFMELRRPTDVQLTGAEYRELVNKLHELHEQGHSARAEHLAHVLGWPLRRTQAALLLFPGAASWRRATSDNAGARRVRAPNVAFGARASVA